MPVRRAAILFVLLTWCVPLASAGPLQDDLKARRGLVLGKLTPHSLAVVWSAPTSTTNTARTATCCT
jgi:hypothetical protein